ncbi:MAG: hypothetical protein JWO03_3698 [Bacteroidetes bacterium]|nr:hypothetical protein [Bacteroidota bacterium]
MKTTMHTALWREMRIFLHMPLRFHICMISLLIYLNNKTKYL